MRAPALAWEIIEPSGQRLPNHSQRVACKIAKLGSSLHPGKYIAQEVGSEGTVLASYIFRRIYEGGKCVETVDWR